MIDDDDASRRQTYLAMFGTTPEAEAEAREMAERQRQIDGERILREAWAAKEAREARAAAVVTKSVPVMHRAAAATPDWNAWRAFILETVRKEFLETMHKQFVSRKRLEDELRAVAKIVCDVDAEICQATKDAREKALEPLRDEIARLRAEVAELRALRSKPATVDEERQRAGEIRRAQQELARLRVA